MGHLNTIVELEGPIIDVQARYWAAHQAAIEAIGFEGPSESEFWRLVRLGAPDHQFVRHGKPDKVDDYTRLRDEKLHSSELMALDEARDGASENLRVLKQLGSCHLATLCDNREGLNATLDRLDIWMYFDKKVVLPESRDRRVASLKELMGHHPSTLVVAGSVPFAYAAGEAGGRVVGIKGGPAFPDRLRKVGADFCFDSLDALTDALTKRDPILERIGLIF